LFCYRRKSSCRYSKGSHARWISANIHLGGTASNKSYRWRKE
jgi:hypothetical protein